MDDKKRIEELVEKLNQASEAYYNDKDEVMSNYEWDAMFDELTELENKTGYVMDNSPTQNTGYEESFGEGNREVHEFPALSLKKSKDVAELQKWAGARPIWLSWKLDRRNGFEDAAGIFVFEDMHEKMHRLIRKPSLYCFSQCGCCLWIVCAI